MSWQPVQRTELEDGLGSRLTIITESNGVSWKLYAIHLESGAETTSSSWWFTSAQRASMAHTVKVEEAEAQGWVRVTHSGH